MIKTRTAMLFRLMHYVCSSVAVKRMQKQGYSPADFAAENQTNCK